MNENNIKVLFPEDVETITISKNDYDRLFGQLTYENIILQSKIDKAIEYLNKNNVSLNELTKDFKIIPTNMIMIELLKGERENI